MGVSKKMCSTTSRRAKEQLQTKFWELYASLKAYRESPTEQQSVVSQVGRELQRLLARSAQSSESNPTVGGVDSPQSERRPTRAGSCQRLVTTNT